MRAAQQGEPLAAAELPDHRPDEPADDEVGEDRRDLDQVADAAEPRGRPARRSTGRTGTPACSRGRSRGRRSRGGPPSRGRHAQNRKALRSSLEAGAGEQVCDDERGGRARARGRSGPRRRLPASRSTATALPCLARAHRRRGQSPGNGSCTSVEGGSERSTGSPGGPRSGTLDGSEARTVAPGRSLPACLLALAALAHLPGDPGSDRYYDHFVWQAAAFLEGQAAIRYPVRGIVRDGRERLLPGRAPGPLRSTACRAACSRSRRCRRSCSAVRRRVGSGDGRSAPSSRCLAAIDVAICWWMLGQICESGRRSDSPRRCSSPSARSSGTRPNWRRPGTRHTSSRSAWRCSRSAWRCGRDPRRAGRRSPGFDDPDAPPPGVGPGPAAWRDRLADRPASVRRRGPVRSRLHRAPDDRVRGSVLHAGRGPAAAGGGAAGRPGSGPSSRSGSLLALQRGHHRAAASIRLRLPVPAWRRPATGPSGTSRAGAIEDPRYLPQNRGDHAPDRAGHPARRPCPTRSA